VNVLLLTFLSLLCSKQARKKKENARLRKQKSRAAQKLAQKLETELQLEEAAAAAQGEELRILQEKELRIKQSVRDEKSAEIKLLQRESEEHAKEDYVIEYDPATGKPSRKTGSKKTRTRTSEQERSFKYTVATTRTTELMSSTTMSILNSKHPSMEEKKSATRLDELYDDYIKSGTHLNFELTVDAYMKLLEARDVKWKRVRLC
jgi:predicted HicB family RNase H-like nuclease